MMEQQDNLPIGIAQEPVEEARHPPLKEAMSRVAQQTKQNKSITFAEATKSNKKCNTHKSSVYKEALSQPEVELTHKQRLQWLQKRRTPGLWVQCDECNQWRFLPHVLDNHELPDKWYCSMNSDVTMANCQVPESPIRVRDEEDLIHGEYTAGSVVLARLSGWPWWPAMVDDDPDTEQYYWLDGFSDIPTHYNVVFFDTADVTRAWIDPEQMKPYSTNKYTLKDIVKNNKYKNRIQVAITQANDAEKLPLNSRLAKYSFISRYPGSINKPKNINKHDVIKYENKMKRKYNFENTYPDSDEDSHETEENSKHGFSVKENNMIILGTTNRKKEKKSLIAKKCKPTDNTKTVQQVSAAGASEARQEPHEEDIGNLIQVTVKESPNQTDSMAINVGSTVASLATVESLDNGNIKMNGSPGAFVSGTSETYVPKSVSEVESIVLHTMVQDVRIASPCSDDFEF